MKKTWLCVLVVVFALFMIADQSWAMGKRGRGGFRSKSTGTTSGTEYSEDDSFVSEEFGSLTSLVTDNTEENNEENSNRQSEVSNESTQGGSSWTSEDEEFPSSTTVPEPATMTMMGMGLASFLLKRRKK